MFASAYPVSFHISHNADSAAKLCWLDDSQGGLWLYRQRRQRFLHRESRRIYGPIFRTPEVRHVLRRLLPLAALRARVVPWRRLEEDLASSPSDNARDVDHSVRNGQGAYGMLSPATQFQSHYSLVVRGKALQFLVISLSSLTTRPYLLIKKR